MTIIVQSFGLAAFQARLQKFFLQTMKGKLIKRPMAWLNQVLRKPTMAEKKRWHSNKPCYWAKNVRRRFGETLVQLECTAHFQRFDVYIHIYIYINKYIYIPRIYIYICPTAQIRKKRIIAVLTRKPNERTSLFFNVQPLKA